MCVSALLRHPRTPTSSLVLCTPRTGRSCASATKHSLRTDKTDPGMFLIPPPVNNNRSMSVSQSLQHRILITFIGTTHQSTRPLWCPLVGLPICVREQRRPKNDSLPCRLAAINCRCCLLSIGVGGGDDTLYSKVSTTHRGGI